MARPKVFQIEAVVEGISPLADGGMSIRFHTNEIGGKGAELKKAKLMGFYKTFGWLQFSDHTLTTVPAKTPVREAGAMTPSQRLRRVIFKRYITEGRKDLTFDEFYARELERLITFEKGYLDGTRQV